MEQDGGYQFDTSLLRNERDEKTAIAHKFYVGSACVAKMLSYNDAPPKVGSIIGVNDTFLQHVISSTPMVCHRMMSRWERK
mgnify:CR=1 FL=1